MKSSEVIKNLDLLFPNPRCELDYTRDYELLIATVLSAQSTDKRVNSVTKILFRQFDIFSLKDADTKILEDIIRPVGRQAKNASYIKEIATKLVNDYNGVVPADRTYLESLPGVGRKVANCVLSEIHQVPALAVDTHVARVSNRLGLSSYSDVKKIEQDLMQLFPKEQWGRLHLQLVLFGRYICKSKSPLCEECPFQCEFKKESIKNA